MKTKTLWFTITHYIFMCLLILSCEQDNRAEIHIPFTLENNRMVFDVTVNGQKKKCIFDSGGMGTYIDMSTIGLLPSGYTKLKYKARLRNVLIFALNKITFNDSITIQTKQWLVTKDDLISYLNEYEGYDGMLGIRTFEGFWCELSFSRNEIVLYKEKPSYFTNPFPVRMLSKYEPLYLPITIDSREYLFNIDTGLDRGIFFPEEITKWKNSWECRKIISLEDVEKYHLVKTNSIHILDETYKDMSVMTNSYFAQRKNNISYNDRGLIGVGLLKYYDLLFDYREIRKGKTTSMYYKPNTPLEERDYGFFSFMKEEPELGILNFAKTDKGIYIVSVLEDSVAYEIYGLKPGVTITTINGRSFKNFSSEELLDPLFYQKVNNFTFMKDGTEYFKEVVVSNQND